MSWDARNGQEDLNSRHFFIAGSKTSSKKNSFLKKVGWKKIGSERDSAQAYRLIRKIKGVAFFPFRG